MTIGDLVRNLVRPRFLIPAFFASALLLATVHRRGGFSSNEDIKLHEFEFNRRAQMYFDGATEISRKLLSAEQLYQKQVYIRRKYIAKNNA